LERDDSPLLPHSPPKKRVSEAFEKVFLNSKVPKNKQSTQFLSECFYESCLKKMPVETYTLDGKEKSVEQYGVVDKSSANWPADKKTLIITRKREANGQLYGSTSAHIHSDGVVQKTPPEQAGNFVLARL